MTPEEQAREQIDAQLVASGWAVQTKDKINLAASRGVALCELSFSKGEPDYTLFVDGKAIGTVEAKPPGHSLAGVLLFEGTPIAAFAPALLALRRSLQLNRCKDCSMFPHDENHS